MVYSLTYRRPAHHAPSQTSLNGAEKQRSIAESVHSGSSSSSQGIPEALSFDRIITGGVCPPLTTRDFMNYMTYIEHDAENLQFYLWLRDYATRFHSLPESERALSPEWPGANVDADLTAVHAPAPSNNEMFRGTDFDAKPQHTVRHMDSFWNDSPTSSTDEKRDAHLSFYEAMARGPSSEAPSSRAKKDHDALAADAFADAGLTLQPFTLQPYRAEISRVVAVYIATSGPRQLNLSQRERASVLRALQSTTHPSAFRAVADSVEYTLRRQSHPNFVRWSICNGNPARVVFGKGLGVFVLLTSLAASVLITLSSAGRAWRVLPLVGYIIGIATMVAAWKGMCVVLHGMHHRHIRPWELFADEGDEVETRDMSKESLVSASTNSWEDEPWVARYQKRNVVRKIFDRERWIQEPALRQIQDTIFLQSLLMATIIGGVVTGVFCAVPGGHFF